ncbi:lipid A deacylase LpxR family protein [Thermodesulfobacteriota bacterium]|jgi:lipid A 3-O-deacylase
MQIPLLSRRINCILYLDLKITFLTILTLFFLLPSPAFAEKEKKENVFNTFTLYWENDTFGGTDSNYTNGIQLSWSTPYLTNNPKDEHLPGWSYPVINRLPFVKNPTAQRAISLSLGQLMFTPEDTRTKELIEDDRPYAGYLYFGVGFNSILSNRKDTWQFNVGVVGPASLAQETQDFVHDLIDSPRAQGWDNQLQNEPAIEAVYETKWRMLYSQNHNGFGYDLIPHIGGRLGNVNINANCGAEFRLGWFIPGDFGSCPIRPGCDINPASYHDKTGDFRRIRTSVHLFTILDSRLVLRDIFLDGNTFKESHSVDKKYFVADLTVGIAVNYRRCKFSFAYTFRTKEFEEQRDPYAFGSFTIAFTY